MEFFLSQEGEAPACCYLSRIQKDVRDNLKTLEKKEYGTALREIAIITIIVSENYADSFSERILFQRKQQGADIRLKLDYKNFVKATKVEREMMYKEHIIESIESLRARVHKADKLFEFDKLILDVKKALELDSL